jgi:TRAP-type mannitol/chloroaromatic compound transport system permease small subunit
MEKVSTKKSPLDRIFSLIDNISEWTGKIFSFLVPISVLVVLFEILTRQFNISQNFTLELSEMLFGATFVMGGSYALKLGSHVTVDIIWTRLSLRKRAVLDLITSVFFFLFVGILIWKGWDAVVRAFVLNERTQSPWSPIQWPIRMVIPIGAFLMLMQGLVKYAKDIRRLAGKEETL